MIAIIEGCGANIASVQFALERLGRKSLLTADASVIKAASHVILPGVGTAEGAMHKLKHYKLCEVISQLKQPVLGICLGMQLLYEFSYEGMVDCLGIFRGKVEPLPCSSGLPVPHMGWNQLVTHVDSSPLLKDIPEHSYVYYVHSYAAPINHETIALTQYGTKFCAMAQHKNFYGVQFHPEKSGTIGEMMLKNFLELE